MGKKGGLKPFNDFIKDASELEVTDNGKKKKLIVKFYDILQKSSKNAFWNGKYNYEKHEPKEHPMYEVREYLQKYGYGVSKEELYKIAALHSATDGLFDCGQKY